MPNAPFLPKFKFTSLGRRCVRQRLGTNLLSPALSAYVHGIFQVLSHNFCVKELGLTHAMALQMKMNKTHSVLTITV